MAILLLRDIFYMVITLHLMHPVKNEFENSMVSNTLEDTTEYTYAPLLYKTGPVIIRRVYSVSYTPETTQTFNITAQVLNASLSPNVSDLVLTANLTTPNLTLSTVTPHFLYTTLSNKTNHSKVNPLEDPSTPLDPPYGNHPVDILITHSLITSSIPPALPNGTRAAPLYNPVDRSEARPPPSPTHPTQGYTKIVSPLDPVDKLEARSPKPTIHPAQPYGKMVTPLYPVDRLRARSPKPPPIHPAQGYDEMVTPLHPVDKPGARSPKPLPINPAQPYGKMVTPLYTVDRLGARSPKTFIIHSAQPYGKMVTPLYTVDRLGARSPKPFIIHSAQPYGNMFTPLHPVDKPGVRSPKPPPIHPVHLYGKMVTPLHHPVDNLMIRSPGSPILVYATEKHLEEHQLNALRENYVGTDPFSTFLKKLVQVLSSKASADLGQLVNSLKRYIVTIVDTGKLVKLGSEISSYIAQKATILRKPIDATQSLAVPFLLAKMALDDRRKYLPESVNSILDDMDDVYDEGEEEAMQRVLREVSQFPKISKTADQIVKGFVDDVFLLPMNRIAGTARGKTIFKNIANVAQLNESTTSYHIPKRRFEENYERYRVKETNSVGLDLEFTTPYPRIFERNKFAKRFSDSRDRYNEKLSEGNKFKDSFSDEDLSASQRHHKRINKQRKIIIPISVNQNQRRSRTEMIHEKSEDNESADSNNDSDGFEIQIKFKNGKYSPAKSMNRKYKPRNVSVFDDIPLRTLVNDRKSLETHTNGEKINYRNDNKEKPDNNIFIDLDSVQNGLRLVSLETNNKKRNIVIKNKYTIKNARRMPTNEDLGFATKKLRTLYKFRGQNRRDSINLRKMGGSGTKQKTKIEYDCKPLPIFNEDNNGSRRNVSTNAEKYSELLIFCDRVSTAYPGLTDIVGTMDGK